MVPPSELEIPFTLADRDVLQKISTETSLILQHNERRLLALETGETLIYNRIDRDAEKSQDRDAALHSRVNSTKFISAGVSAVFGFLGGLVGLPIKGAP